MKTLTEYTCWIDWQYELPDYWQGDGTCGTPWNHCVIGCGSTLLEAFEDMLEMLAWDADGTACLDAQVEQDLKDEYAKVDCADDSEADSEALFYLTIKW